MNFYLESFQKTFHEVAVPSSLSKVSQNFISFAKNEKEVCEICKTELSKGLIGTINTYEECVICHKHCCGKCISKKQVPDQFRIPDSRGKTDLDWVCSPCEPFLIQAILKNFKIEYANLLISNLERYFALNESFLSLFHLPNAVEDTISRKMYRLAQVAEKVMIYSGLSSLNYSYQAIKYAYMGRELYSLLITDDFSQILGPVVAASRDLGHHGIINL